MNSITPDFVVVVGVLLPIYCHIGSELPNMCNFVEDTVELLGEITNKWV